MWAFLLIAIGTALEEASSSIGKYAMKKKMEGIFTLAFINVLWSLMFFGLFAALFAFEWRFAWASIPFVAVRLVLDTVQILVTMRAIAKTSRSTFGFVRTLTIPLLLIVDLILGYQLGWMHVWGLLTISLALFLLYRNHGLDRRGLSWALVSAVNAVLTISIYKFNVTQFNSVLAEQVVSGALLLPILFVGARWYDKQNPFRQMRKPLLIGQSASIGFGSVLESYAFLYAAPSILIAVKRSLAILWSIVFGHAYFHEKRLMVKLSGGAILIAGLVFLGLGS